MSPQELELSTQDTEQELLLESFKAAANCLTNLYRNSLNVEKRAKNLGFQCALENILSWVGEQASTGKQTVSLEELVSFCYHLCDQLGSGEVSDSNLKFRFGERKTDIHVDTRFHAEQQVVADKNNSEYDQSNVSLEHASWFGVERKRSRKAYEGEFSSQGWGPNLSEWSNKDWNGENKLQYP